MAPIVIPFRGPAGKQRIDAPEELREQLALAMLGDVVSACLATDRTLVVTRDEEGSELVRELGAELVEDPGGGQGPAVVAGLAELPDRPALVVNADLPCVVPHDVRTLAGAAELGALRSRRGRGRDDERARAPPAEASSRRSTARAAPRASASMPRRSATRSPPP